ncbi:MAG: Crp/Fnr family transcriptional regulator [Synechococcus sp.]
MRAIAKEERESLKIVGIWGPNEYVGTFMSRRYTCQLECMTEVTLEPVSLNIIEPAPLLLRYIEQLEVLLDIALERQVSDRLVKLFSWLSEKFGTPLETGILIQVPLTHQDIADVIGSSREAVTRILGTMEDNNQISFEDRLIVFKTPDLTVDVSSNN